MKFIRRFILIFIFFLGFSTLSFAAELPEVTSPAAVLVDNYTGTVLYKI